MFVSFGEFSNSPRPFSSVIDSNFASGWSAFFGEVGQLQEYRSDITGSVRLLAKELQVVGEVTCAAAAAPKGAIGWNAVRPFLVQPTVCNYSSNGLSAQTHYFCGIQDELVTLVCETRVALRKALTWLNYLLGCVSAVLSLVCKLASSAIPIFCSVTWEKRRWFLHHGARPPKTTVRAIMSLLTEVCSRSLLAF